MTFIDLGDLVIDPEAQQVIWRTKSGAGAYDDGGNWQDAPFAPDQLINAVVQPAAGTALRDLPEGERKEAQYFLWTQSAVALDDIVIYGGNEYRIVFIWPRPEGGYTRAAMGRKRDGQGNP